MTQIFISVNEWRAILGWPARIMLVVNPALESNWIKHSFVEWRASKEEKVSDRLSAEEYRKLLMGDWESEDHDDRIRNQEAGRPSIIDKHEIKKRSRNALYQ